VRTDWDGVRQRPHDQRSKPGARIETTLSTNPSITLLVNNAGVGATALLLDSDVEKMDDTARRPLEGGIPPASVDKGRPNKRR